MQPLDFVNNSNLQLIVGLTIHSQQNQISSDKELCVPTDISMPLWKRWLAIFMIFKLFINSGIAQVNLEYQKQENWRGKRLQEQQDRSNGTSNGSLSRKTTLDEAALDKEEPSSTTATKRTRSGSPLLALVCRARRRTLWGRPGRR